MIPETMLGTCRDCWKALVYNVDNLPFCVHCNGLRIADLCPWCGHKTKGGVEEQDYILFCKKCGHSRELEFSQYDVGRKAGSIRLLGSAYRYMKSKWIEIPQSEWLVVLVVIEIMRLWIDARHLVVAREMLDKIDLMQRDVSNLLNWLHIAHG
jgi:hypothetical protein